VEKTGVFPVVRTGFLSDGEASDKIMLLPRTKVSHFSLRLRRINGENGMRKQSHNNIHCRHKHRGETFLKNSSVPRCENTERYKLN
jgi:hypothetical protein